jgi:hypothetical protein
VVAIVDPRKGGVRGRSGGVGRGSKVCGRCYVHICMSHIKDEGECQERRMNC